MDKAEESALTEGGEVTMFLLTRLLSIASSNESVIQQILQVPRPTSRYLPRSLYICSTSWAAPVSDFRCLRSAKVIS